MSPRLDRPSTKVNVRVFTEDYSFIQARTANTTVTPTDVIRNLISAWVRAERARMTTAALAQPPAHLKSAHEKTS